MGSADSKGLRPLPPTPKENGVCTRLCVFPFCVMYRGGTPAPAPTAADPGQKSEDPPDRLLRSAP